MLYYACCAVTGLTVEVSQYLTLMWMLAAAVHIFYVQYTTFEGGGGRFPPLALCRKNPGMYWVNSDIRMLTHIIRA